MTTSGFRGLSAVAIGRLIPTKGRAGSPAPRSFSVASQRSQSNTTPDPDPATILSRPTWSVRSLLPQTDTSDTDVTPSQLRHLLRLSALPSPSEEDNDAETARMIAVLRSQLGFVRDIRSVDAADAPDVVPLTAIRDETPEGLAEATIGLEQLRETLSEEVALPHTGRPRRRRRRRNMKHGEEYADVNGAPGADAAEIEGWDPLQTASRKAGRYFVVRSAKST